MNNPLLKILCAILFLGSLSFSSCNDDDVTPAMTSILPYDGTQHIYGTMSFDSGRGWEVAIDPATGAFDTLPGSFAFNGLSLPIGATRLTAFSSNERIFLDAASDDVLYLQDLTTFTIRSIPITDPVINKTVVFPQYLSFGASEAEIYLLDTDESIWWINTQTSEVRRLSDGAIFSSNNDEVLGLLYVEEFGNLLVFADHENAGSITKFLLFDPENNTILDQREVAPSFGIVKYPKEDRFYYLKAPVGGAGFRLMWLTFELGRIKLLGWPGQDLAIDQLSPFLQTIHTATNTYICRGGSPSIDNPTNRLYSIDLSNGRLLNDVSLENSGIITNLSGE